MTKKRMTELYGKLSFFIEAFTSVMVEHETQHDVYEMGDTVEMDFYKVTFNDNEFMTLSELDEIYQLLGDALQKNGVDTSAIKLGRTKEDLEQADWSGMSVEKI